MAHGIIDRVTQDVDLFTDDEHGVESAAAAVQAALLALEDVLGGKVCALASRAVPRDYWDTAAVLDRLPPPS